MSLCTCTSYESDGSDYEVREDEVREEAITDSTIGDETESEHEAESGIEYKFPSDEEPGSESEVDPNEVKDINDEDDENNETRNEEKGNDVPSDEKDKLPDEIKQLLNKKVADSKDSDEQENEESSDDDAKLPDEIKQFHSKGKDTEKQSEKPGDGESGKKDKEDNDQIPLFPDTRRRSADGRSDRRRRYYTDVKFPSGKTYSIFVPQATKEINTIHGVKTKLITLRPGGKIGRTEYRIIVKEMEKTRADHDDWSCSGYSIVKIQKIVNPCLWRKYRYMRKEVMIENHGDPNERMLFHGSPAYQELLEKGFDERFSNPKGMFGAGLYFAKNSSKSTQYAFGMKMHCPGHDVYQCMVCERTLILCRVILGRTKKFTSHQHLAHAPAGFHSVEGIPTPEGLKFSETIIYRGEQVYPEYLITYNLKP